MRQKKKIYVRQLPMVTKEFAEEINKLFPEIKPAPGVSHDRLQYNAGQRSVVETILKQVNGIDTSEKEITESLLERMLNGFRNKGAL